MHNTPKQNEAFRKAFDATNARWKAQTEQPALTEKPHEQESYIPPSLSTLRHSDNCRYWDDNEYCTCGEVEYHELKYWKAKALALAKQQPV